MVPKTGVINLKTWRDFTKVMKLLAGKGWLYRGHDDSSWKLQTSLEREMENRTIDNISEAERSAIRLFRANARVLGENWDSDIDALVAMQHHGAKTRLLDFTTSIMVALFFAFETMYKEPKTRVIYAVNFKALCKSNVLRDYFRNLREGFKMIEIGNDRDGHAILLEDVEFREFISDATNDIITNGCSRKGIFPLYTALTNKRQQAQSGVQLMPCTFHPFVENLAVSLNIRELGEIEKPTYILDRIAKIEEEDLVLPTSLIKLVFDPKLNEEAWDILDQSNINPFTIYPDLIGLAKSMRYTSHVGR